MEPPIPVRCVDVYRGDAITAARVSELYSAGVRVVYIKASEGGDLDTGFDRNVALFQAAGILIGAYHYVFAPRENQREAALLFADLVDRYRATDVRPLVDFENSCSMREKVCVAPAQALEHAETFAQELESALGVDCAVYSGKGYFDSLGPAAAKSFLVSRPMIVADYNRPLRAEWEPIGQPMVPNGVAEIAGWQYTNGVDHKLSKLDRTLIYRLDRLLWLASGVDAYCPEPPTARSTDLVATLDLDTTADRALEVDMLDRRERMKTRPD